MKDCLQPKEENADNRPNCCELLQKINEFSVDKSLLTKDNILEEFQTVLDKQKNGFLKTFFNFKINWKKSFKGESKIKRHFPSYFGQPLWFVTSDYHLHINHNLYKFEEFNNK